MPPPLNSPIAPTVHPKPKPDPTFPCCCEKNAWVTTQHLKPGTNAIHYQTANLSLRCVFMFHRTGFHDARVPRRSVESFEQVVTSVSAPIGMGVVFWVGHIHSPTRSLSTICFCNRYRTLLSERLCFRTMFILSAKISHPLNSPLIYPHFYPDYV